ALGFRSFCGGERQVRRGDQAMSHSRNRRFPLVGRSRGKPHRLATSAGRDDTPRPEPGPNVCVPPDRSRLFMDREPDLEQLARRLEESGRADLTGLGGVGKTALAIEHLHRRRSAYPNGVFWIRGETESTLAGDFAALAWRLELEEQRLSDQRRVMAAVTRW